MTGNLKYQDGPSRPETGGGRVFNVQERTYLVAKVISTSSGRVFGATTDLPDSCHDFHD